MVGIPAVRAFIYVIEVYLYDGDQYRENYYINFSEKPRVKSV